MKREDFSAPETGTLETIRGHRTTTTGLIPYETVAFTPSENTDVLTDPIDRDRSRTSQGLRKQFNSLCVHLVSILVRYLRPLICPVRADS